MAHTEVGIGTGFGKSKGEALSLSEKARVKGSAGRRRGSARDTMLNSILIGPHDGRTGFDLKHVRFELEELDLSRNFRRGVRR